MQENPRKRVLLADDDLEMREVVRQVLEAAGMEVEEVSSGVMLLSRLADDGDFDLVVTDVRMPWITGEHVMQMARAAEVGLAVGVLSGLGTRETLAPYADVLIDSVAGLLAA